jgi:hypothetical protein
MVEARCWVSTARTTVADSGAGDRRRAAGTVAVMAAMLPAARRSGCDGT